MVQATVNAQIENAHYKLKIQSAKNTIFSDEPLDNGGQDEGFSPPELLSASLAACTSITLRMYADRKKYPLDSVDVEIKFTQEGTNTTLHRIIKLNGNLTQEQRERLMQIANQCYIHRVLSNPIQITTSEKAEG